MRVRRRRKVIITQYCNSPRWFILGAPVYTDFRLATEALDAARARGYRVQAIKRHVHGEERPCG